MDNNYEKFGEIAYEAYCDDRGWKSYDGKKLPVWGNVQHWMLP